MGFIPSHVDAVRVTSSNTTDLTPTARALYVAGAGNVRVGLRGGSSATYELVPAGTVLEAYVTRVYETGTSATSILALY